MNHRLGNRYLIKLPQWQKENDYGKVFYREKE